MKVPMGYNLAMESSDKFEAPLALAICVATCGRPRGLKALLDSLGAQENVPENCRVVVFVADNAAAREGMVAVNLSELGSELEIKLVEENRAGIPFARNCCLDLAASEGLSPDDFLIFVDDDEALPATWLATLLSAQAAWNAEILTGPVKSRFQDDADQGLIAGGFFELQNHEDGATVDRAYTNNTMVRYGVFLETKLRFDERMAERGGSDTLLFRQFVQQGKRIFWAQQAFVWEDVPSSRVSSDWILKRAFRLGANAVFIERVLKGGLLCNLNLLMQAASRLGKGLLSLVFLCWCGPVVRLRARRHLAYGLGHLAGLLGLQHREYREIHGA